MTSEEGLDAKFVCPFEGCNSVFNQTLPFTQHKRSHTQAFQKAQAPEHKCHLCGAVFNRPNRLESHLRSHNGERPFACNIGRCSKSYTNSSHLKRHIKLSHEENPVPHSEEFMCGEPNCGKVFITKFGLKRHVSRNHKVDSKPYACEECGMRFTKRNKLQAHMGLHGPNQMEEYRCTRCTVTFPTQVKLSKHLRNHKTYVCDCSKTFERWTEICRHRRTSCTEKKEHKCAICDKVFVTNTNLRVHSMTHVEESQIDVFRCPYRRCNRCYKYKKNLSYHISFFHEKIKPKTIKPEPVIDIEDQDVECKVSIDIKEEPLTDFKIKEERCESPFVIKKEPNFRCKEEECESFFTSKKNLNKHRRLVHLNLPAKKRTRKDKGKKKKPTVEWVLKLSEIESGKKTERNVSTENYLEIIEDDRSIVSNDETNTKSEVDKSSNKAKSLYYKSFNFNLKRPEKPESKRIIAPLGSRVFSRKRKAGDDECKVGDSTENSKKLFVLASAIESDAPIKERSPEADQTLDRLKSTLEIEHNVTCKKELAEMITDNFTCANKEIEHIAIAEENSIEKSNKLKMNLKPLKITIEKLNLNKIKDEILANTFKIKQLKIVLYKMDLTIEKGIDNSSNININKNPEINLKIKHIDNIELATKNDCEKSFGNNMTFCKPQENDDHKANPSFEASMVTNEILNREHVIEHGNKDIVKKFFGNNLKALESQIKNDCRVKIISNVTIKSPSKSIFEKNADTHQHYFEASTATSIIEDEFLYQNNLEMVQVSELPMVNEKTVKNHISTLASQENSSDQAKMVSDERTTSPFKTISEKNADAHQSYVTACTATSINEDEFLTQNEREMVQFSESAEAKETTARNNKMTSQENISKQAKMVSEIISEKNANVHQNVHQNLFKTVKTKSNNEDLTQNDLGVVQESDEARDIFKKQFVQNCDNKAKIISIEGSSSPSKITSESKANNNNGDILSTQSLGVLRQPLESTEARDIFRKRFVENMMSTFAQENSYNDAEITSSPFKTTSDKNADVHQNLFETGKAKINNEDNCLSQNNLGKVELLESAEPRNIFKKQFVENMMSTFAQENSYNKAKIISDESTSSPFKIISDTNTDVHQSLLDTSTETSSGKDEFFTENALGQILETAKVNDISKKQFVEDMMSTFVKENSYNKAKIVCDESSYNATIMISDKSTSSPSAIISDTNTDVHQELFETVTATSSKDESFTKNDLGEVLETAKANDISMSAFVEENSYNKAKIVCDESFSSPKKISDTNTDVHQDLFETSMATSSNKETIDSDSQPKKPKSGNGQTLEKIKDILKDLSSDQVKVENALEKIKKILEINQSKESEINKGQFNSLVNAGKFESQVSSSSNSSEGVQIVRMDTVSIQNFVSCENVEIVSCPLGENIVIMPLEADC